MSKIYKYTAIGFLWLACIVLFAHPFIPHDHHSEISIAADSAECSSHQNENNHHSNIPIHCHALNDLAFEKLVPILTFSPNFPVLSLLSFEINDTETFVSTITHCRYVQQKELITTSYFLISLSLKAPPTLV